MIKIDRIYRDRTCGYCNMSEYRPNYDGRKFYTIRRIDGYGTMVISICEYCARELIKQLSETIKSE